MERGYWLRLLWGDLRWYLPRGRWHHPLALVRTLWRRLRWHDNGETCQDCGRPYILWHADDALYSQVTGRVFVDGECGGLFCPSCFDRMAERKGIRLRWRPEVF